MTRNVKVLFVILFAMATVASGSTYTNTTTLLNSSFTGWTAPISPLSYFTGYISSSSTLTQSQGTDSWLDWQNSGFPQTPWFSTWSYNEMDNMTSSGVGLVINGDPTGSFGQGDNSGFSATLGTVWATDSTYYPLEDRVHFDAQVYRTLDTTAASNTYTWDCRDLVLAGLSGTCGGSDADRMTFTNSILGGVWLGLDFTLEGQFINFQSGAITPYSSSYTLTGFNSWSSQPAVDSLLNGPSSLSSTPEPGTWVLVLAGGGLALVGKLRRHRSLR